MRYITSIYQKSRMGRDEKRHSAKARARQMDSSTYVWLDYAMIRSMSRRCRFR